MAIIEREDVLAHLTNGIEALTTSGSWQAHLEVQGRFHRYSFSNAVLICAQDPGASQVAGFVTWKKLGRSVRKGERAIWILAPMIGRRVRDADGDERRPVLGFRTVPVFDVTQTDGAPLPEVCRNLAGDDPESWFAWLVQRAAWIGYSVERSDLPGTTNGDCAFSKRRIRVESRNEPAQQVKTLAHELAHAILHEGVDDRPLAELEAESTAFVVCRSLGFDTSDYSFGYVACWAGGGPEAVARIKTSGSRIQRAASVILDSLEISEDGSADPTPGTAAA
jgi:antirestriction protein ArdC